MDALYYILISDVNTNSAPVSSKLDTKFKDLICNAVPCLSFCTEAAHDSIKSEWIETRNRCRTGEADKCRELIKTLSENFRMKPNVFCKNSDLNQCDPTEITLCFIVGGQACYNAIKGKSIHDTVTIAARNAACKSGVPQACDDLNKFIKDNGIKLFKMCQKQFTTSCLELMEAMMKDGQKEEAIQLGVSFCRNPDTHWNCFELFEKSAPENARMVFEKLKTLCILEKADDGCLGYALELKKSDLAQAITLMEKICAQSSIDRYTPGYYACWEVFENFRLNNKIKAASLLVGKLCLYQTKIDVFYGMDCQAKKLLALSRISPNQKASSANCAHRGVKDFLDDLGNVKFRLNCKGGLRNGLSEFDRTTAGNFLDVRSQEVEYKDGIAHGLVRIGHYSSRYKVAFTVQDGVLNGSMKHLNEGDSFSRGLKLTSQFKDGIYNGVSVEEHDRTLTFKEGLLLRSGPDASFKRDCKNIESQILPSSFNKLRTLNSCAWPHKVNLIHDKTAGVVTDRRRILKNKKIEISKFKDGFVVETILCNPQSKVENWKKYFFGGWKSEAAADTKPYYKIFDVPYVNDKLDGVVSYYSHGKSYEQIRFKNGMPDQSTRIIESIPCAH